jgi:hypothetical protein
MNVPKTASAVAALVITAWSCSGYVADTSLAPGDTVRVEAPRIYNSVATVAALETDTLVVQVEDRADALSVPLADVTKLEVRRGQKSNAGRGSLIGSLVGAGAGAALGALAGAAIPPDSCANGCVVGVAGIGALAGGAVGALVGLAIGSSSKSDRWEAVPLDQLRVGPSPVGAEALAVSVTLRL